MGGIGWRACILVVSMPLLSACAASHASSNEYRFTTATPIGQLIPISQRKIAENFHATLLNGQKITLAASAGQVRLVNFWASWCSPCVTETPQFDAVYRQLKSSGVTFLGVNTKDEKSAARSFVAANDISYPIAFDEEGAIDETLGEIPGNLPFSVLIDKHQRVAAVYLGGLTAKDIKPPLQKLRAES